MNAALSVPVPDIVKKGIARESAILYPFEETRKALYEGGRRHRSATQKIWLAEVGKSSSTG